MLTVYDPFTVVSLMQIEDMGFCPKGEVGAFVEGDTLHHDAGKLPFNTHGGLLSHAYVLGIAHVVECVKQLRGTAPAQVPDCEVAVYGGYTGPHGEHARARARTADDGDPARRLPAARRRRSADRAVLRGRGARRADDHALRRVRASTSGTRPSSARACDGPLTWTAVSGAGTLFSWAVVRRAFLPAFADQVPFVTALVALAEDPAVRLPTYLVDADPDTLRADEPVRVTFRPLVVLDRARQVGDRPDVRAPGPERPFGAGST